MKRKLPLLVITALLVLCLCACAEDTPPANKKGFLEQMKQRFAAVRGASRQSSADQPQNSTEAQSTTAEPKEREPFAKAKAVQEFHKLCLDVCRRDFGPKLNCYGPCKFVYYIRDAVDFVREKVVDTSPAGRPAVEAAIKRAIAWGRGNAMNPKGMARQFVDDPGIDFRGLAPKFNGAPRDIPQQRNPRDEL